MSEEKTEKRGLRAKVAAKVAKVKEKGLAELEALTLKINEFRPVLESLGYELRGAKVHVGLPPSVSIGVGGLSKPVDKEAVDAAIAENKDDKMLVGIIKGLSMVSALRARLPIDGFRADMAEVVLGLPPSVTLLFERK